MALAESWHIRSRARSCSVTDRPFEDGETIVTALFPDPESSGYVRKDFSVPEWKNRDEEVIGKPFSFWKAVYHVPVAGEKKDAFRRESPEELLRRLVEEEEDHTENARYILAVMLERKKVLRETDTQRTPDGILRVYEHRKLGDIFIVRDPDIPLSEVGRVQDEVMILLEQSSRGPQEDEPAEAVPPMAEKESAADHTVATETKQPPTSTEAAELPAEGAVEEEAEDPAVEKPGEAAPQ